MTSTVFDLVGKYAIEKGFPWSFHFTRFAGPGKIPVDLTGLEARLDIYDALNPGAAILSVGSASGEIDLGGVNGTVAIALPGTQTNFTATHLRYRLSFINASIEQVYLRGRLGLIDIDV